MAISVEACAIGMPDSELDDEKIEQRRNMMFTTENVRNKKWDEVLKYFEADHDPVDLGPLNEGITSTGETLLHMAVRDNKLEALKKLTESVKMESADNRRNTCLHLAAKMGYTDLCNFLADKKPDLISNHNSDNETPLFLAVLYGWKTTFFALAQICESTYDHDIYEYGCPSLCHQ